MTKSPITGLRAWLLQRFSAIYLLLFFLFALAYFVFFPPDSYQAWHDWITSPAISIATMIFFAALLLHAWVGLRDVILDYVKPLGVRVGALALLGVGLLIVAMWVARVLFMAFGQGS